jgi:hypothetical protein
VETAGQFGFFNMQVLGPSPAGDGDAGSANPDLLPIEQWFEEFFVDPFPSTPRMATVDVAGRPSVRLEIAEGTGPYTHIYLPSGADIVEISFPSSGAFVPTYEAMLRTLSF